MFIKILSDGAVLMTLPKYITDLNIGNITALHGACRHDHDKSVSLRLQAGAIVDTPDKFRETPLLIASKVGHLKCVILLVDHGA